MFLRFMVLVFYECGISFGAGITMLERTDCLADRSGMVREIVDYLDPAHFAAQLLPARDSFEALERLSDVRQRHAVKARGRDGHGCVPHIEPADGRHLDFVFAESEARAVRRIRGFADSAGAIR